MIIKKFPEDFIVEEVPALDIAGADGAAGSTARYAIYRLTKSGLNTEQAVSMLCERFHIKRNDINYAGAKDRNALSSQYISILGIKGLHLEIDKMSLEYLGLASEPLSLGSLKGNRFKIILRELEEKEKQRLENNTDSAHLMPNYFDEQRFSENNFDIGLAILKKDFAKACALITSSNGFAEDIVKEHIQKTPTDLVGAIRKMPKKTLSIYLHSVQSYIFNNALSSILKDTAMARGIVFREVPYSKGTFIFYNDEKDYEAINDINSINDGLSLAGFDTQTAHPKIKEELGRLGLKAADFIIRAIPELSLEGTQRECVVEIEEYSCELSGDNTAVIKFYLPKGSYATIAIKAITS